MGGIGGRHARNLKELRPDASLTAVRAEHSDITRELEMELVPDLNAGLEQEPQIAIVALPPAHHAEVARSILEAKVHLYLEKPVALQSRDLAAAVAEAEAVGVITMSGCNMRFMPGFMRLREIVRKGKLGRLLHARLSVGQWLPDWRPDRDYRDVFSSKKVEGGGVIKELIHEIDMARFLFGEFDTVTARASISGSLDMDCEDNADILLRRDDLGVNIHLDCLDRAGHRDGRVQGDEGTASYDALAGTLFIYGVNSKSWRGLEEQEGLFVAPVALQRAMAHFVECVESDRPTNQPISEGLRSLELAERASEAAGFSR